MSLKPDRLKILREQKGLSQRQLAHLCDIGVNQINRYEAGLTEPSGKYLAKISEVLNVSVDYLLGLSNDPYGRKGDELTGEEQQLLDAFKAGDSAAIIRIAAARLDRLAKQKQTQS